MARTHTISFYTGDYEERLSTLFAAAQDAERRAGKGEAASRRLSDSSEYQALTEEFNALQAEAKASAREVTLQAISRKAWMKLKADHPARVDGVSDETRQVDARYGINVEAAEEDLLFASLVSPEFQTRAAFDEWALEELTAAEFGRLVLAAFDLIATAPDPKSLRALPTLSNAETSS